MDDGGRECGVQPKRVLARLVMDIAVIGLGAVWVARRPRWSNR